MKKYLTILFVICLMLTGCGVSKENPNANNNIESTKIESSNSENDNKQESNTLDDSQTSVEDNETNTNSDKKSAISSAGEEIEINVELPNDINENEESTSISSTTYSMISTTNVMSEDAGHDGAVPPTLELKDDMTFILNHNSTETITGTYEKSEGRIICSNNSDKYVFTDNSDGTLNFNAKDSSIIEKKNDNEFEIKDGSLFFSN